MSDSISTQIGAYAGYISLVLMIGGTVVAAFNHRRIRSSCCGARGEISIDIDNTSPKPKDPPGS
jgi:hypothetical protein